MSRIFRGIGIVEGIGEGEALVSRTPIAFNLGVDERTGVVVEKGHELESRSVAGKILLFPGGKGSTASSFSLLQLAARDLAPRALVNVQTDAIVVAGAVLAKIPLVHRCAPDILQTVKTGDPVRVDGSAGTVTILGDD